MIKCKLSDRISLIKIVLIMKRGADEANLCRSSSRWNDIGRKFI